MNKIRLLAGCNAPAWRAMIEHPSINRAPREDRRKGVKKALGKTNELTTRQLPRRRPAGPAALHFWHPATGGVQAGRRAAAARLVHVNFFKIEADVNN